MLQHAGLSPRLFDQPRTLLATDKLYALWRGIGQISQDPAIGLKLNTVSKMQRYDPISLAALCMGSFKEALRQMARYKQLTCPEEILSEKKQDEWSIQFR